MITHFDNKGVHNFSLGCLDAYFHLNQAIEKSEYLIDSGFIHLRRAKKVYVFDYNLLDLGILKDLQKSNNIYSLEPIDGLEKRSRFKELAYNLGQVFNPSSYPNKKKRHARIKYPFTWIEKHKIEIDTNLELAEVEEFHSKWVEHKLADPKVFRMMFPTARYINCFKKSLIEDPPIPVDYRTYGFYLEGKLSLVRVVSVQRDYAYDLANFGNTWDAPSQFTNYCDVWVLKDLYNKGINVFNCGAMLNKRLAMFKSHFPSFEVISYGYGKIKEKKESKVSGFF